MHKLLLTFDVEDFVNANEISALRVLLEMLEKYKLKGLFFISGYMAEKLANFPKDLELLRNHEIGFHSSGHSVHPIIAEYTDLLSYKQAFLISLKRETAHINPLTGKAEREGGIYALQELFKPKRIRAYRAPGMSWTPPNLEALSNLGIEFDFSSSITTSEPVRHKGITFYPDTFMQHWMGNRRDYQCLLSAVLKRKIAVLDIHPTQYMHQKMWDSIYYGGNPAELLRVPLRPAKETGAMFQKFELLLKQITMLQSAGLLEINSNLMTPSKELTITQEQVLKCYEASIRWPQKYFKYTPRFIYAHFKEFFQINQQLQITAENYLKTD